MSITSGEKCHLLLHAVAAIAVATQKAGWFSLFHKHLPLFGDVLYSIGKNCFLKNFLYQAGRPCNTPVLLHFPTSAEKIVYPTRPSYTRKRAIFVWQGAESRRIVSLEEAKWLGFALCQAVLPYRVQQFFWNPLFFTSCSACVPLQERTDFDG